MVRAFLAVFLACGCVPAERSARPKADAGLQAERERLMGRVVEEGYVLKHEPAVYPALPRVWVTRRFHEADIDMKDKLTALFATYYAALPKGAELERGEVYLLVLDGTTGKEVGQFDWRGYRAD